jgi:response regulator RpfG family c-di-GMP phosphodiesterase
MNDSLLFNDLASGNIVLDSGYPLEGAYFFTLVNVLDALNSDRPYRPTWPKSKVIGYMKDMASVQFDPALVPEFIDLIESAEVIM